MDKAARSGQRPSMMIQLATGMGWSMPQCQCLPPQGTSR
ncbi:hypothetical protein L493_3821 [Bordetella bronchiseptica 99-R-0433]|nr:hypothetical protein L493_3821 [Bordetella bronchiseptica 99-R-0433]